MKQSVGVLRRFFGYFKPHLRLFWLDTLAAILLAACDLFYPSITRSMLNTYIPEGRWDVLAWLSGILLAVYLLKMGLNYFTGYYGHVMGVRMQADMRRDMFTHLEKLPFSFFDRNKTGALMSRLTSDLMDVSELAHHGPEDLIISAILLVGSFTLMAMIHLPLALICFFLVPILFFFTMRKRKEMTDAFHQARVEMGEVNASLENSIAGIRVSRAYNALAEEEVHFAEGNSRFVEARRRSVKAMGAFMAGSGFMSDVMRLVVLIVGGLFVLYAQIDYADLVAFILFVDVFLQPIRKLISFVEQYQNGMSGFLRFCEIMDAVPEEDAPDAHPIAQVQGDLRFSDVCFSYETGETILQNISFHVPAGHTLALVGPSGGGKSTVCHLIPRFYEIESGAILLDGQDIRSLTRRSLRDAVAVVAQDLFLFNASVYDNIVYARQDASPEEVYAAAQAANIDSYIRALPDGYDTIVGERGVRLSGGQRQRISIARAFLKNAPLLILDEATSALDTVTERLIQESLDRLCAGRTVIVVAHRLSTIRRADEILFIDHGRITERGNHAALIAHNGAYAALCRAGLDLPQDLPQNGGEGGLPA